MIEYIDCLAIADGIDRGTERAVKSVHEQTPYQPPTLSILCGNLRDDDKMFIRGIQNSAKRLGIEVRENALAADGVLPVGEIEGGWDASKPGFWATDVDGVTKSSPYTRAVSEAIVKVASSQMDLRGKTVTVIGRGIGKEVADLFITGNATVALAHSKTTQKQLDNLLSCSDVIVCATRGAKFSTQPIKDGAVVIDIGDGFTVDEFNEMEMRKIIMTPKRNGVGVITRSIILRRVADCAMLYRTEAMGVADELYELDVAW